MGIVTVWGSKSHGYVNQLRGSNRIPGVGVVRVRATRLASGGRGTDCQSLLSLYLYNKISFSTGHLNIKMVGRVMIYESSGWG